MIQGCGKTTGAVACVYEDHLLSGRKVISNDHLNFDFTHFDISYFLEHIVQNDTELEDCILLVDEFYQIADSRSSATKLNKLWSYFVVQTRKRGVDLYICTHHLDHIDLRNRRAVDIRGACRFYLEKPCKRCRCGKCNGTGSYKGATCDVCHGVGGTGQHNGRPCDRCHGYGEVGLVRIHFLDRRLRRRYTLDVDANKYWHLFNTRERIPLQARILQGIEVLEV